MAASAVTPAEAAVAAAAAAVELAEAAIDPEAEATETVVVTAHAANMRGNIFNLRSRSCQQNCGHWFLPGSMLTL